MPNLGNVWHIPDSPEPRGRSGMRDPFGAAVPGSVLMFITGNQFQGGGNPGNQLQAGSTLLFRKSGAANWTPLPLIFLRTIGNNKYYLASVTDGTFTAGDSVEYYFRIAYDDHDTTFLRAVGATSSVTEDEQAARNTPFRFTVESSAVRGQWGPLFALRNVAIHASLLPNGLVLMWGRRDNPGDSLDEKQCTPFLWNPQTGVQQATGQPKLADGTTVNLFCSGHAFLPDGRLLVAGGHLADSDGVNQACIYDSATNQWTPAARMNRGRWYPTALTLPDGSVLVLSGSFRENGAIVQNVLPQVWKNNGWISLAVPRVLDLYPRNHVAPDGRVFVSGPMETSLFLRTSAGGQWTQGTARAMKQRDYCPSVMYDSTKVMYIGGGNDGNTHTPTAEVEVIELSANPPRWRKTQPMNFRRRQHNAVVLPDGSVLAIGGTRGGGGPSNGFNDLGPGQPVHIAELWDPATEKWTQLAAELNDRCYHGVAVLLPDATVLSAGGGEYRPFQGNDAANDPEDSHRDAQIFSPPYLFKGPRPDITLAPSAVDLGQSFDVGTSQPDRIEKVSWLRLASVTHSFDQNQRIVFLPFQAANGKITVQAPQSGNASTPGHYMMFLVDRDGVPSIAKIIQMRAPATPGPENFFAFVSESVELAAGPHVLSQRDQVLASAKGTAVTVGITGTCPYGIGACWGGAYEALGRLDGVDQVNPVPDAVNSTAEVFLMDERLPAIDKWDEEFRAIVNGRYELRGVEVTLRGVVEYRSGHLAVIAQGQRPSVSLAPLVSAEKVQYNYAAGAPREPESTEAYAYQRLKESLADSAPRDATVTGPLKYTSDGYRLLVRAFAF